MFPPRQADRSACRRGSVICLHAPQENIEPVRRAGPRVHARADRALARRGSCRTRLSRGTGLPAGCAPSVRFRAPGRWWPASPAIPPTTIRGRSRPAESGTLLDTIDVKPGQPIVRRLAAISACGQRGRGCADLPGRAPACGARRVAACSRPPRERPRKSPWTDPGSTAAGSAAGITDLAWQPELWRALIPGSRAILRTSPLRRVLAHCAARASGARATARLSLFGPDPAGHHRHPGYRRALSAIMSLPAVPRPSAAALAVWRMCAARCPSAAHGDRE